MFGLVKPQIFRQLGGGGGGGGGVSNEFDCLGSTQYNLKKRQDCRPL